jgi:hypothetical protein
MNIRTAFTADEIAAWRVANKPDHPTAKGFSEMPERFVVLQMTLEQLDTYFGCIRPRKSPRQPLGSAAIWEALQGFVSAMDSRKAADVQPFIVDTIESLGWLSPSIELREAIARVGGAKAVAEMMIESKRIFEEVLAAKQS